jgi:hypothetical protein
VGAELGRAAADLAVSSSYDAVNTNDGQAAITRQIGVGSATATLAARLATLSAASSVHGDNPPRRPVRESASSVVDAATIIPSTENGVSAATQPGCPRDSTSRCM